MSYAPKRCIAVLSVGLLPFLVQPVAAQNPDDPGRLKFNGLCKTCHSVKENDNRLGPNLHAIVGRKSGAAQGYTYSSALSDGKLTWDEATLEKFIENPDAVAPGHNMKPFGGVNSPEDRKLIIGYLKTNPAK